MITILLIILVLMVIGSVPAWTYSREWGYRPNGGLGSGARDCLDSFPDGTHRKRIGAVLMLAVLMAGCTHQDTEKTKQKAEKATEKIKEEAKEAAKQSKAALEGVKQGLETPDKPVNVNSASRSKLQSLPGVDEETADRIIAGRPYQTRNQLLAKGAVSPEEFKDIKDKILVK